MDWIDRPRKDQAWCAELTNGQVLFRIPPDVEIRDFDADTNRLKVGEQFTLEVEVRNNGPGKSAPTEITLYYSPTRHASLADFADDQDLQIAGTVKVDPLSEGRRKNLSLRVEAPMSPDDYYYGAFLPSNIYDGTDYKGELDENQLFNNWSETEERVTVTSSPDLVIESISTSAESTLDLGETFRLETTVKNHGIGEPEDSPKLSYYLSSNATIATNDEMIASDTIRKSRLNTNETSPLKWKNLTAPSQPGTYYYGVCVERVDNEEDTTNNCSPAVAITVREKAPTNIPDPPDLIVEAPSVNSNNLRPGQAFTLEATVRNRGGSESGNTTLRYHQTPNTSVSDIDTEVGTVSIGSLNTSSTETQRVSLTAPIAAGTYYYGACVDSVTDETDRNNNCSITTSITVQNLAPVKEGTIPAQTLFAESEAVVLDVAQYFSDPNNDVLTYTAQATATDIVDLSPSGLSDSSVRIDPLAEGQTVVTVTANDGSSTATQTIAVTVLTQNSAPLAVGTISAQTLTTAGIPYQIDVAANFSAPNIHILTYTVSSNDTNVATATVSGTVVTITPHNAGNATVMVTASDGSLTASQTIGVTVTRGTIEEPIVDVCSRTSQVRDAIAAKFGVDCADITPHHLVSIASLFLSRKQISTLKKGDFSGLTNLVQLELVTNQLTSLEAGIFSGLSNLRQLQLVQNDFPSLPANIFSGLQSLELLNLNHTGLTTLDSNIFSGLGKLQRLDLMLNEIGSLPAGIFSGLTDLNALNLKFNPGAPFTLKLQLVRTDSTNLKAPGPATVKVRVAEGAPFEMRFGLSVEGGTLSANRIVITKGSIESSPITVTADGANAVTVNLGTPPAIPIDYSGIKMAVGESISLFTQLPGANQPPTITTSIPAQVLSVNGSARILDLSNYFSDPDNDSLTYTAVSSVTSVATVGVSGTTLTIIPQTKGRTTVTAVANDGSVTASQAITVTVETVSSGNVCSRTPKVRDLIMNWVSNSHSEIKDCIDVTSGHLASVPSMNLQLQSLASLKVGDFSGLSKATIVWLNNNQLTTVPAGIFSDLTSMTDLSMGNNRLTSLDANIFNGLSSLQSLGLSQNQLSSLDANIFDGLSNLQYLSLAINQLSSLDANIFDGLSNLKNLYLRDNQFTTLDANIFDGLSNLKILNLENNQLTTLPAGIFSGLNDLEILKLAGNPGAPFTFTLELARTDNTDLTAPGPATIKIKVAEGMPFDMSISLSVTGGTLSATTATIATGATESNAITVTQSGANAATVSLGAAPTVPPSYSGIQTTVGSSLVLFTANPASPASAAVIPETTALLPNFPNPFNPETWFPYQLSKGAEVTLTIYDMRGIVVRELTLGYQPAGIYHNRARAAQWDGRNAFGEPVASGVYFYTLAAGEFEATGKMLIRK